MPIDINIINNLNENNFNIIYNDKNILGGIYNNKTYLINIERYPNYLYINNIKQKKIENKNLIDYIKDFDNTNKDYNLLIYCYKRNNKIMIDPIINDILKSNITEDNINIYKADSDSLVTDYYNPIENGDDYDNLYYNEDEYKPFIDIINSHSTNFFNYNMNFQIYDYIYISNNCNSIRWDNINIEILKKYLNILKSNGVLYISKNIFINISKFFTILDNNQIYYIDNNSSFIKIIKNYEIFNQMLKNELTILEKNNFKLEIYSNKIIGGIYSNKKYIINIKEYPKKLYINNKLITMKDNYQLFDYLKEFHDTYKEYMYNYLILCDDNEISNDDNEISNDYINTLPYPENKEKIHFMFNSLKKEEELISINKLYPIYDFINIFKCDILKYINEKSYLSNENKIKILLKELDNYLNIILPNGKLYFTIDELEYEIKNLLTYNLTLKEYNVEIINKMIKSQIKSIFVINKKTPSVPELITPTTAQQQSIMQSQQPNSELLKKLDKKVIAINRLYNNIKDKISKKENITPIIIIKAIKKAFDTIKGYEEDEHFKKYLDNEDAAKLKSEIEYLDITRLEQYKGDIILSEPSLKYFIGSITDPNSLTFKLTMLKDFKSSKGENKNVEISTKLEYCEKNKLTNDETKCKNIINNCVIKKNINGCLFNLDTKNEPEVNENNVFFYLMVLSLLKWKLNNNNKLITVEEFNKLNKYKITNTKIQKYLNNIIKGINSNILLDQYITSINNRQFGGADDDLRDLELNSKYSIYTNSKINNIGIITDTGEVVTLPNSENINNLYELLESFNKDFNIVRVSPFTNPSLAFPLPFIVPPGIPIKNMLPGVPIYNAGILTGGGENKYPSESLANYFNKQFEFFKNIIQKGGKQIKSNTEEQYNRKIQELYNIEQELKTFTSHKNIKQIGGTILNKYEQLKLIVQQLVKTNKRILLIIHNLTQFPYMFVINEK